MSQFSFDFFSTKQSEFKQEDFLLLPENAEAVNYVKKMLAQENYSNATLPTLIIKGEKCSGKTHLLHAISSNLHSNSEIHDGNAELELGGPRETEFLNEEKITSVNLLNFLQPNHFYFLENIDEIKNEELLLSLINSAAESQAFLILTTRTQPNFQIKDLMSRLKNMAQKEIKEPSTESVKQLVTNQLARKQIKSSASLINQICNKVGGNYAKIVDAIKLIEGN
jgi:chromosomal replication initiation ATPase DnaA